MSDFDDTLNTQHESSSHGPNGSETYSVSTEQETPRDLYLDTETCGLHGLAVLIQYAVDDGEIELYEPWRNPVQKTIELLEWIVTHNIIGFNLAFDWFHIVKLYTTFVQFISDGGDPEAIPLHNIEAIAVAEEKARYMDITLKPPSALDLMLHARKGPYQSLMARDDIRVKRIPRIMAERLRTELEKRIQLDGIYFNKRSDKSAPQWNIYDCKTVDGDIDPDFVDVVLKFHPDGALKSLAEHVLKETDILKYGDIELDHKWRPEEEGYAPFALAVGRPGRWNWAWPEVIQEHIYHWAFNQRARQYAKNDIVYTRGLRKAWPEAELGDDDSVLACMVGCVRWHGFEVNLKRIAEQRVTAVENAKLAPTDHGAVKRWLFEVMNDLEQQVLIQRGTNKVVLTEIGGTYNEQDDLYSDYWETDDGQPHPAALRAREVFKARKAKKEVELYDKLLKARRFHASFVVIGTLSTRMSGADGLNPQGIISSKHVRGCFTLADDKHQLDGGDFDNFEVGISAAVYQDKGLEADIKSGKKLAGLIGEAIFPDQTYESIMASKGSKTGRDYYTDGKRASFGLNYGGDANTLVKRLGIAQNVAEDAFARFDKRYPGVKRARQRIIEMFCSMRQPGGIGSRVEWHEPEDKIESLLGFPRYFTLENRICKALYDLANNPPSEWRDIRVKVVRRDREQTAAGACQSALFGAAFGLQGQNMRAAANHVIQSSGAGITKRVERRVWDHQPVGIHRFLVQPMNIHDEIMSVNSPEVSDAVKTTVDETVASYVPIVPLIEMGWQQGMTSWASK